MRRTFAFIAGATLVAGPILLAAQANAEQLPVQPTYVSDDDDDGGYGYDTRIETGPLPEVPPWCGPGNTFIVVNGFCLRTS